jgi:hypothetical protein
MDLFRSVTSSGLTNESVQILQILQIYIPILDSPIGPGPGPFFNTTVKLFERHMSLRPYFSTVPVARLFQSRQLLNFLNVNYRCIEKQGITK